QLQNIVACKNNKDNSWSITFESKEDMRPKIFDFAQENGLKILALKASNKSLETLFREVTL
ncbi:MAG: ABC-2 type transport system ATP-binding protein, partial [Polaribacter sp.]